MGLPAVEHRDLMAALERITNLERSGETSAAENKNAEWFRFLGCLCLKRSSQSESASSGGGYLDEIPTRSRCHAARSMVGAALKRNLRIHVDAHPFTE